MVGPYLDMAGTASSLSFQTLTTLSNSTRNNRYNERNVAKQSMALCIFLFLGSYSSKHKQIRSTFLPSLDQSAERSLTPLTCYITTSRLVIPKTLYNQVRNLGCVNLKFETQLSSITTRDLFAYIN